MPHVAEVRVVYRNLRWEVRLNGRARPMIDWLCTKGRAIDHALERAREAEVQDVVVEGLDWSIEQVVAVPRPPGRLYLAA